jgi:cell division protein FtsN
MVDRNADSGHEMVLDNRKLIIVFAVLIATWGCFFVLGFRAGKRQGYQEGSQMAAETVHPKGSENKLAQTEKPGSEDAGVKTDKVNSEEQSLDWYKNVNRREGDPQVLSKTSPSAPEEKAKAPEASPVKESVKPSITESVKKPKAEPKSKPKVPASDEVSKPITYSVQVGAFRVRREVEIKAKELRSKDYDSRIESPQTPDQLYLLKIGRFNSRAEAIAMQLRLKKSGFTSFIKTN